jgi:hypothetical protein
VQGAVDCPSIHFNTNRWLNQELRILYTRAALCAKSSGLSWCSEDEADRLGAKLEQERLAATGMLRRSVTLC